MVALIKMLTQVVSLVVEQVVIFGVQCVRAVQVLSAEMAAIQGVEASLILLLKLVVEEAVEALRGMEIMLLTFKAALVAKEQTGKA